MTLKIVANEFTNREKAETFYPINAPVLKTVTKDYRCFSHLDYIVLLIFIQQYQEGSSDQ